ncbi:hypothetical protein [Microbispora rosea]|nr:hypothetical protein [Microbispora rosea]
MINHLAREGAGGGRGDSDLVGVCVHAATHCTAAPDRFDLVTTCRVSRVRHPEAMTRWFRAYWDEEDVWFYFEVDAEGWVSRQVELRGPDGIPIAAASLTEWQQAQAAGRLGRYEATYGRTAETPVQEWDGYEPDALTAAEFEDVWSRAHQHLNRDR